MADYIDVARATKDATFRDRVQVAATILAFQIHDEPQGTQTQAVWEKRTYLARQVINQPSRGVNEYMERFIWAVAVTVADPGGSTDGDLLAAANAVWNDIAGVTPADL